MSSTPLLGDLRPIAGRYANGSPFGSPTNTTPNPNGSVRAIVNNSSTTSGSNSTTTAATTEGNLMDKFNKLLQERAGIRDENLKTQEEQLQRMNTQKNNAAFQNQYKMRDNLVSVMQQLLDNSRRSVANSARIFT